MAITGKMQVNKITPVLFFNPQLLQWSCWSASSSRLCLLWARCPGKTTMRKHAALYLCGFCVTMRWSVVPRETPYRRSAAAPFCTCSVGPSPAFWEKKEKIKHSQWSAIFTSQERSDVQAASLRLAPTKLPKLWLGSQRWSIRVTPEITKLESTEL